MAEHDRELTIRLTGPLAEGGSFPISLVADKLAALQRVLFNVGSALRGGGKRGSFKTEVLQECELLFVQSRPGSLDLVTRVDHPASLLDLGQQAVGAFWATVKAVEGRDSAFVSKTFPDASGRARVLKSMVRLLPEDDGDYGLALVRGGEEAALSPAMRPFLNQLSTAEQPTLGEVRTLTGTLFRIEVATGQRQLGILVHNRQIRCFYDSDYEDVVRELVPGSLVEVEGLATLDERGDVHQIETILDARSLHIAPLSWQRVAHQNRVFHLKQPVLIRVDFQDGVWVHALESLGILSYATTRSESLRRFREEFAATWDAVANEPDVNLTDDGRHLRDSALSLVEREEVR